MATRFTSSSQITAVVLAAGEGKRLAPLTNVVAKEMIPIWGRPVLFYILDNIRLAGITKVVIVTSGWKLKSIKAYFDSSRIVPSIRYAVQSAPLGPAHAISATRGMIQSEYFMVQYGDSIADINIPQALVERFRGHPEDDGILALRRVDDPSRYGIVRFKGHKIARIVEKPKSNPPSDKAVIGTFILRTQLFFKAINKTAFEYGKEEFPPQYVLRSGGKLGSYLFEGSRVDVGKPKDLFTCVLLLQKLLSRTDRNVRTSAVVFDSDNTIFQTRGVAEKCDFQAMKILSRHVGETPEHLMVAWKELVNDVIDSQDPRIRSRRHSYGLLCKEYGVPCQEEMFGAFNTELGRRVKTSPEALNILRQLRGQRLFLVTEDERITTMTKLRSAKLDGLFEEVLTSTDVGIMKPSVKYYEPILKKLGLPAWRCIVVGDSFVKDLVPAIELGMHTLLIEESSDLKKLVMLR